MERWSAALTIGIAFTIGLSDVALAARDNNKRPVAMIPGLVTPPPVVAPVYRGVVPVQRSVAAAKQMAKGTYPSTHLQKGFFLKQRGDIDGALLEFLKAVQEDPRNVRAFYEQALIFKQRGYTKLAQSALQQAVAVRPDFRDARMMLASIHLEDGELTQAARELFGSLGINLGGERSNTPQPKPDVMPVARAVAPTMIQTPHGEMRLPVPVIQRVVGVRPAMAPAAPPTPSPVAEAAPSGGLPDLTQFLKGIPGVDPNAKPEDTGDAFASAVGPEVRPNGEAVATSASVATSAPVVAEKPVRADRKRRRRVAAWLDNMLDGGHVPIPAHLEEEERQSIASEAHFEPKLSMNPLKFFQRLPLPILRPFEHHALPAPEVARANSVPALPPAPLPLPSQTGENAQLPMPQLAPQAKLSANLSSPSVVPLSERNGAPTAGLPQPVVEASAPENDPLQAVLNMLPKDLAATVAHVLQPKPVEIATTTGAAPQLQNIRAAQSVSVPTAAPQPVAAAASPERFENLVSAKTAADNVPAPFVPSPVRQSLAPSAVPLPLPSPLPNAQNASLLAPAAAAVRNIVASLPGVSPLMAPQSAASAPSAPSAAPAQLAPTSNLNSSARSVAHSPSPTATPVAGYARVSTAPLPVTVATTAAPTPVSPSVPQYQPGAALPAIAPVATSTMDGSSAPELVALNVPAPQVVPQYVPSKMPSASVQFASSPVAQRLAGQGFKFVAPAITEKQRDLLNAVNKAAPKPKLQAITTKPKMEPPPPPEDDFTKRMRYLLAHGTASLGPGEAFMFSEETGEGVLFLPGGANVRRKLADSRDAEQVARLRRPDILQPQGELQYNLSLLGKIIKAPPEPNAAAVKKPTDPLAAPASPLTVKDLLGKEEGFMGWIKNVFKL